MTNIRRRYEARKKEKGKSKKRQVKVHESERHYPRWLDLCISKWQGILLQSTLAGKCMPGDLQPLFFPAKGHSGESTGTFPARLSKSEFQGGNVKNRIFFSAPLRMAAWFRRRKKGGDDQIIVLVRYNPKSAKIEINYYNVLEDGALDLLKFGAIPFLEYRMRDRDIGRRLIRNINPN
jgi:hypothetical protein